MEYRDLIINALDYYDKCIENISNLNLTNDASKIKYQFFNDETLHDKLIFTDEHNNKTEFIYEYIGKYLIDYNTWIWGWSIPEIEKKSSNLAKRVLNYGINMPIEGNLDMTMIKIALINSRIVTSSKEVEILCGVFLYFTKVPYIYMYVVDNIQTYLALIPAI